ncbi:virion structural protein [Pseudomonas phage Psa21]|uniref:Virion structural protein n=1 Tax=Pseudomonas phage Psa21 TaxID=2530023 RepID=A0A481W4Q9_9CAUD|nr:virion structural protein [Pseudomonas phage Psa21]QBJ02618.1 virion structural protein [Pseudomonas phage Psa21]
MLESLLLRSGSQEEATGVYRGEVTSANFISGADLASAIGLTEGVMLNAGTTWLKFVDNGKTFYIPKMPIRNTLKWTTLDGLGAVRGTAQVTIGNKTYKVRLMTGATTDPGQTVGAEYRNYFLRCTEVYTPAQDRYANFTIANVGWLAPGNAGGGMTLVQEKHSGGTNRYCAIGYQTLDSMWYQNSTATNVGYGWRPLLEEI